MVARALGSYWQLASASSSIRGREGIKMRKITSGEQKDVSFDNF